MKLLALAKRNTLEIVRDPLNLFFGLGFPLVLLLLLSAIQANVPTELFPLSQITPGLTVFGLSFITLFAATILTKDRSSALLQRLYTTPLHAKDFILGYTLPLLPIAVAQSVICYLTAAVLGLSLTANTLYAVLFILPVSLFFVGLGLLCGSLFNDKQVGGICGALFTNLAGWFSGTWFDINLVGEGFRKVANLLPYLHAVELERAVLAGDFGRIWPHLIWVLGYGVVTTGLAVWMFLRQSKRQ